jgi:cytochrome bd ubiquinol oxidase subunit II
MLIFWFCAVAVMVAMYVVLDGFDLGAGIIHFCVARNEEERRINIRSIGPVWDGNEVWLLAGGGTLYFAFPALYASSFSGFYLPLMMVLWLLILRAISIEFRNHIEGESWKPFWDFWFCASSGLLAIFFGAALGNVVRGVPLDQQGNFFLPLWTNFNIGPEVGILDWYTILIGLAAFATLTMHGALWVNLKTTGAMQQRARRTATVAWMAVAALTVTITVATFLIQPQVPASYAQRPWGWVLPALALAGLAGVILMLRKSELKAFLASALYIIGMLTSVVFGVFPYVLPSSGDPQLGLTIYNASAPEYGLRVGLAWFLPGMLITAAYFIFVYRRFAGKVTADSAGY